MAGFLQSILGIERCNAGAPGSNSPVLVGLRCFDLKRLATGSKRGHSSKKCEVFESREKFLAWRFLAFDEFNGLRQARVPHRAL